MTWHDNEIQGDTIRLSTWLNRGGLCAGFGGWALVDTLRLVQYIERVSPLCLPSSQIRCSTELTVFCYADVVEVVMVDDGWWLYWPSLAVPCGTIPLCFSWFWWFLDVHCGPHKAMNSSTLGSEVWLHVAGAEALSFDEFPIPSGEHEVVRRGQNWKLQAVFSIHLDHHWISFICCYCCCFDFFCRSLRFEVMSFSILPVSTRLDTSFDSRWTTGSSPGWSAPLNRQNGSNGSGGKFDQPRIWALRRGTWDRDGLMFSSSILDIGVSIHGDTPKMDGLNVYKGKSH